MNGSSWGRIPGLDWLPFSQQQPTSKIFVSYRREDARGDAGRLTDRLKQHFGDKQIFRDVEAIEAGLDFVESISSAVGACAVLLAIIGPNWLKALDASGQRRLDDPHDFVRLEVSAALNRGIRVVPVLVGGAPMPTAEQLPEPLQSLARRQAHELSDSRWDFDVQHLIETLERAGIKAMPKPEHGHGFWTRGKIGLAAAGVMIFVMAAIYSQSKSPTMEGVVPAYNTPQTPLTTAPPMPPAASRVPLSYSGFDAIGRYPTIVQVYEPT